MKKKQRNLLLSTRASRTAHIGQWLGQGFLFSVTSLSLFAVLFIFFYIAKDAIPFFRITGFKEFFTSTKWYPSAEVPEYGVLSIMYGTAMVTLGAIMVAVPLGLSAAVCLSDVLPFRFRQIVKPVIEMLAAIPSVAYGFFALVVFAPVLQDRGGPVLSVVFLIVITPLLLLASVILADLLVCFAKKDKRGSLRIVFFLLLLAATAGFLITVSMKLWGITVSSGTNALNVSFILGMMALPTIVSVAEDALQAAGRDLREGSYALGATRAETLVKVVIPAAMSGIAAAVILGIMRAVGETMVVWMASGNTARIPEPWYNFLAPVRTLTASIAGDMGEAARGTQRFHVLFAMALTLLVISFLMNLASQAVVNRQRKKLGK